MDAGARASEAEGTRRVVGIDPGSQRLGWGILDMSGSRRVHVASGIVHAPKADLAWRLRALGDGLLCALRTYAPREAAVEDVFCAHNARSALILGQARGVALYCLATLDIPVTSYTAGQIKLACTGHGAAAKQQVRAMVRMVFGAPSDAPDADHGYDRWDALAAALCHVQHDHALDGSRRPRTWAS